MDKQLLKELKKVSNALKPQFHLGKAGITDTFLKTIDDYLTAHNIVKIKVTIAENKDESDKLADLLAEKVFAQIIEKKGFTFTLHRDPHF